MITLSSTSISSSRGRAIPPDPQPRHFVTPDHMVHTLSCIIPVVSPFGVISEIPRSAWDPVIARAHCDHGVDLTVDYHGNVKDIAHLHFTLLVDDTALPAALVAVAQLIAETLAPYTRRVRPPEGK